MPTAPAYVANAGMNGGSGVNSRTVYLPVGWSAGQIAIMSAICEGAAFDITTPDGWTRITTWTQGGDSYGAWYWRRLEAGDSSGGWTLSRTSSTGSFAIVVSTWSGVVGTGAPLESVAVDQNTSSGLTSGSITPSMNYCCVACFTSVEDNFNVATLAGGNYAEKYDLLGSSGNGIQLGCNSFGQTTAANEPARAGDIANGAGNDNWATLTVAFYPRWEQKINGVTWAAGTKINGVSKALIRKVNGVS